MLGPTFLTLLAALTCTSLYSAQRLHADPAAKLWLDAGLQAAAGITTLSLTYTLLGISLGIGSMADQPLTPETVQEVIRGLTQQFSLAFMTTVIGLPLAAVLRALLTLIHARSSA